MEKERPESHSPLSESHSALRNDVARSWIDALTEGVQGVAPHPPSADHAHPLVGAMLALTAAGQAPSEELERIALEHGRGCARLPGHSAAQLYAEFRLLRALVRERATGVPAGRVEELIDRCCEAALQGFSEAQAASAARASEGSREEVDAVIEAVRLRDELLSMVSHELRSPLAALLLELQFTERALKRTPVPAGPAEALTRGITRASALGKRMAQMLDRLLDLSRIRTDRFGLEIAAVDLCAVVQELVNRLQPQAEATGGAITVQRCAPELFAYVDPLRIEQVLTNLITNAIKYGAGKPIEVALEREGEFAILEVRDHGIGIPEADLHRIFERYVRATRAHRSESLGLGLFITREIVRAHGGTIEVHSREGEGSTFRVALPTQRMT